MGIVESCLRGGSTADALRSAPVQNVVPGEHIAFACGAVLDPDKVLLQLQQELSVGAPCFQRCSRFLTAIVTTSVCEKASLYGLVDSDVAEGFVLVTASGPLTVAGVTPPQWLWPLLQRMLELQRPVSETKPQIAAARTKSSSCGSQASSTSSAACCYMVCAVPLFEGSAITGALVLEAPCTPPQPATSPPPPSPTQQQAKQPRSPSQHRQQQRPSDACCGGKGPCCTPPPLLSNPSLLQQLGLALSVGLGSGLDAGELRWLAAALRRVSAANSMHALVWALCEDVAAFVRRKYIINAHVRAALLPRFDAAVGLLFHAQPATHGAAAGALGRGSREGRSGRPSTESTAPVSGCERAAGVQSLGCAACGKQEVQLGRMASRHKRHSMVAAGGAPGGDGSPMRPAITTTTSKHLLTHTSNAPGPEPPPPQSSLAHPGPLPARAAHTPSDREAAPATATVTTSSSPSPFTSQGPTASATITTASSDPAAHGTATSSSTATGGSSRTVVVPLPPHMAPDASCSSLHAQAFLLKHTVLQALAPPAADESGPHPDHHHHPNQQQQQQPQQQPFRGVAIEDVALYVQNVHSPSRDVCLLMGEAPRGSLAASLLAHSSRALSGAHAATAAAVTAAAAAAAASTGAGSSPWPTPMGSPLGAGASGGGGGGGVASLVLTGVRLGDCVLGFYLCFAKRLPGELLEAVRGGCNQLLEEVFLRPVHAKLEGALAPEFDTLRSTTPGHFAVLRSRSSALTPATTPGATTATTATAAEDHAGRPASQGGMTRAFLLQSWGGGLQLPRSLAGLRFLTTPTTDTAAAAKQQQQQTTATASIGGSGPEGQAAGGGGAGGVVEVLAGRGGVGSGRLARRATVDLCFSSHGSGDLAAYVGAAGLKAAALSRTASFTNADRSMLLQARSTLLLQQQHSKTAAGSNLGTNTCATHVVNLNAHNHHNQQQQQHRSSSFTRRGGGGGGSSAANAAVAALGTVTSEELLSALLHARLSETAAGSPGCECRSASFITVTGVDAGVSSTRQQLDLLVTSIHTTMTTDGNGVAGSFPDELEQLELYDVVGRGAGGVVYRGRLGTQEVAVKVMELPDVDAGEAMPGPAFAALAAGATAAAAAATAAAPGSRPDPSGSAAAGQQGVRVGSRAAGAAGDSGLSPAAAAALAKEQLRARRALLRNAMEMAVQGRLSHPNLLQVYAAYTHVTLERRSRPDGSAYHCLLPADNTATVPADLVPGSPAASAPPPVCCAIVAELADGGSLAAALAARAFPRLTLLPRLAASPNLHHFQLDLKGVYMTLLDVALALRHLHSLNLVHRDLKPANLLLKSNPRDHRGFTVKLADFGFVLNLTETAEDGSRYAHVDQACGTVTHMAPELLPGRARMDASVDVYSFGILMWELVAGGMRPFPHLHPDQIPRQVYKGARPMFGEAIPLSYRSLAQGCWAVEPQRRPRAAELVTAISARLQELG